MQEVKDTHLEAGSYTRGYTYARIRWKQMFKTATNLLYPGEQCWGLGIDSLLHFQLGDSHYPYVVWIHVLQRPCTKRLGLDLQHYW